MKKSINKAGRMEEIFFSLFRKADLRAEARKAGIACRRQLKGIGGGYNGSGELFRSEVLPFWKRYGVRPGKMWYDLYCHRDGRYDPRYIPEDIYWRWVYPALNRPDLRRAYTDKCFYDRLFPYLKKPRTILKSSSSCFFDGDGNIISKARARSILESEHSFVIKPAIYSGEGVDVCFHEKGKDDTDLQVLMDSYGRDYIVQEIAAQHEVLASVHPHSLNTIRVISFLFRGEVHISSSILRVGVAGSRVDNFSAGGLACPIRPDGSLGSEAMDRNARWTAVHPGGAVFAGIKIPSYERIIEAVRRAHRDVAHFRVIGWDFSVDEGGDPLFIEYNGAPSLNQISCGPLFGDHTEPVLNMIFLNEAEFAE